MEKILPKNVALGDVVRSFNGDAFCDSAVVKIKDGFLHLFRPYVQLSEFDMGDSVIPYIGFELYQVSINSPHEFWLLRHTTLR